MDLSTQKIYFTFQSPKITTCGLLRLHTVGDFYARKGQIQRLQNQQGWAIEYVKN